MLRDFPSNSFHFKAADKLPVEQQQQKTIFLNFFLYYLTGNIERNVK